MLFALAAFVALGVWQVKRLHWKHDLIARVDARVHAAPAALPPTARLASAAPGTLDYLRVKVTGTYAASQTALVRAATDLGTGYWAMTPLHMTDGRTVWINRGFLPAGTTVPQASKTTPSDFVSVTGLVRPTEPGGSLLQSNRPQDDRWYSRDLAALSQARHTGPAAPVFIDAQTETASAPASGKPAPVPGLTVIQFPDNHLQYALTWFAMALLSAVGIGVVWRRRA
ncbi:SURF1 family protein [Novosphingobium album (ex Hu et al. 2023)]|uniref:SURF1-like protein n=1 Tax=Novosphingobium album (ex Hu et al. 2023) TaxID=2930093 RepID=A0ABT0B2P3_9SPHN|nr:SURF1 family protein [Novosphingobium album (ex Hu et al. 2023)]MCJ2179148.1 SURF1 family protein [Novosphingobium album (ex Hu et al. 2023)]